MSLVLKTFKLLASLSGRGSQRKDVLTHVARLSLIFCNSSKKQVSTFNPSII